MHRAHYFRSSAFAAITDLKRSHSPPQENQAVFVGYAIFGSSKLIIS